MILFKKRVGLALSGGGTRGFAHLGVIKAFEELNVDFDVISGTSAGSIIGALVASGRKADDLAKLMKEKKFHDFAQVAVPVDGLMKLGNLRKYLKEEIPHHKFSDMKKPLIIAVTNLYSGNIEYLENGDVIEAVIASSSIPVLFTPVEINGQKYVDGGVLDNLPIHPLLSRCKRIVAVDIMPLERISNIDNLFDVAVRSFQIGMNTSTNELKKKCALVIEPKGMENYHILDSAHFDEMFISGYNAVMKHPRLKEFLVRY